MISLGDLLRKQRERANLSINRLAKKSDISKAQIHDLEHGLSCNPTIGTLAALARALDIPLSLLASVAARGTPHLKPNG